jgi:hypothetical protein
MMLVHQNLSLLSSSLQSSVRLLLTSTLSHHPTIFLFLSSRHYYNKVAQQSISNGILSLPHRPASSMRNGLTGSSRDDEDEEEISLFSNRNGDKDNHKTGDFLLIFTSCNRYNNVNDNIDYL